MIFLPFVSRFLRKHKILTTILFTIGLILFFYNSVFADELDITDKYSYLGFNTFLYMDDTVLDYIRSTDEYKEIGTNYYMVGILNTSVSEYQFYFTPYNFGTPSQFYLYQNRFILAGNFSYIKYSTSSINFNPDNAVWNKSTGTNSGNTTYSTYRRSDGNNYYYYYWGSANATWFADWNGFIDNFPVPFVNPSIDDWQPGSVTANSPINVIRIYPGSLSDTDDIILDIFDNTYSITSTPIWSTTLNKDNGFIIYDSDGQPFVYAIAVRFVDGFNNVSGNVYRFTLTYSSNGIPVTAIYNVTMDFSSDTTENIQDNTQQNIQNELQQTNAFLNSDHIDDSDIELPSMEVEDFTASFFTTLVGSIVESFTNFSNDETIQVDFRNYHTTVHSSDFDFLRNITSFTPILDLISLAWIFAVGYWIFCDFRRRLFYLKEFHWSHMFADDISTDLL